MHADDGFDDGDDLFRDSRMPLGEHLEVLRLRMWRAILGFGVALVVSFVFGSYLVDALTAPAREQLVAFQLRKLDQLRQRLRDDPESIPGNTPREVQRLVNARVLARKLGLNTEPPEEWILLPTMIRPLDEEELDRREAAIRSLLEPGLRTLAVTEACLVYFKVCAVAGLVLASPWIFWQAWAFVAAGLYPGERRQVYLYLPFSIALFLGGVALCQLLVLPRAVAALLWFNEWLGLEPELRLGDWLSFALLLPIVFGIAFETPLVMLFLERIGICDVRTFRRQRRLAWMGLAVVAAVVTPTPDIFGLLSLWLPVVGLFELGVLLCAWWPRAEVEWEELEGIEM